MMKKHLFIKNLYVFVLAFLTVQAQAQKGSLFIIGGGSRTPELLKALVKTAQLRSSDYIVVLPMASGVPKESVEAIKQELGGYCTNAVTSFNFSKEQANSKTVWIDSVKNARLIYITGGDQNRFMNVVKETMLYQVLHQAYNSGATIAGTSAGAAVMSAIMITGEEADKADNGNFTQIAAGNVVTAEGMGFLSSAIIDQHFIKRSRYNRLLSILADHPDKMLIGIDESTAIIVMKKRVKVVGESEVVLIHHPKKTIITPKKNVAFKNAKLSLLVSGDQFKIK